MPSPPLTHARSSKKWACLLLDKLEPVGGGEGQVLEVEGGGTGGGRDRGVDDLGRHLDGDKEGRRRGKAWVLTLYSTLLGAEEFEIVTVPPELDLVFIV